MAKKKDKPEADNAGVKVVERSETLRRAMEGFPAGDAAKRFGGADGYHARLDDDGLVRLVPRDTGRQWQSMRADVAPGDDENTVDVSFSSEAGVKRWGVREILSHAEGDYSFTRLAEVGGVLRNHDPDQLVGAPENVRVDTVTRKGLARVRFGTTEDAEKTKHEVMVDKTLKGISVGYVPGEWIWLADEEVKYKGHVGPAYIAVGWEAIELSFTPVPMDASVGVGRADGTEEDDMDKEQKKKAEEEARAAAAVKATEPTEPTPVPAVVQAEPPAVDAEEIRKVERERSAGITRLCSQHGIEDQVRDDMISNGVSLADAQTRALDVLNERQTSTQATVTEDGRTSFSRAVMEGLEIRTGRIQRRDAKNDGATFASRTLMIGLPVHLGGERQQAAA